MGLKIGKKVSKESIKASPCCAKYTQYMDEYKKLLLDHREWMRKADHLREATNLFREKIKDTWTDWTSARKSEVSDHFISIYFMLSSYALENLFKALIVLRRRTDLERELKENPNKLPDQIRGHDLYGFARKCMFSPLDAGDEEFLRKLTRSASWYGRYPIPTKPSEFKETYTSEDKTELLFLSSYATTDVDQFEKWVEKIKASLDEEAKGSDNFNQKSTDLRRP